jgi:hypothetical protein
MKALGKGCVGVLLAAALACRAHPRVSDTGYVGTWQRGSERALSTIAIVKRGSGYLFRWRQSSSDDRWEAHCGWDGKCAETIDRQRIAEYTFRASIDGKTGHLVVECSGRMLEPKEVAIHDVDEVVVEPGGLSLGFHTLERNGEHYRVDAGPARWFKKISDDVDDPP